ncbi:MAG: hypothetical protein HY908_17915 [Myxococcales bacterium]|nr:hypothetical protein [Myxococcales bacterium]
MTIGRLIVSHRQRLAQPRVEALVRGRVDAETANEDLLAHLVAESLLRRIDRNLLESKNIYVERYAVPQIVMFYRLARAIPFIAAGHMLANEWLIQALAGHREVTVLDIGIGLGTQMRALLEALAKRSPGLERLRLVAIDPAEASLDGCRENLVAEAGWLPFEMSFHPIHAAIESLGPAQLGRVVELCRGPLGVNAAFALHHTTHAPGDTSVRTRVLAALAALRPEVVTLVEPHANHDTESLPERIHGAWRHFGPTFELIDASSLDAESRFTIKETFFGRELRDIFGVSDAFRCERHEPYDSWLLRLARAGFEPATLLAPPEVALPPSCALTLADGIARLSFRDTVIVAVLGYRPRRRPQEATA